MRKTSLVLVLLILLTCLVYADSYLGPKGLLTIPTADVSRQSVAGFGVSFTENKMYASFKATFVENLELGITGANKSPIFGFFKWRLINESPMNPAFAVGATGSSIYGVISQNLGNSGLKGHIGYGNGMYGGFFLGLSYVPYPVTMSVKRIPIPIISLMGEYVDHGNLPDVNSAFNFGARFQFTKDFSIDFGLLNFKTITLGATLTTTF